SDEPSHYSGRFNAQVHIVACTGGRALEPFGPVNTTWSNVKMLSSSAADAHLSCFTCDHRAQAPWTLQDEHRF
ncbi:hypothetical protein KC19_VG323800, partial [Ceratodon purpureus]